MHRVCVLMGTRPEAVKLAPVVAALQQDPGCEPVVVNTGQHRELIAPVIELFRVPVDHDLSVMRPAQSLAGVSARLLEAVDGVLEATAPDLVLVQGDTVTVLAGALAAFYRRVPVGHVEAGLRTDDLAKPFPEEGARRMVSRITRLHFAPTERAQANLLAEGVDPGWVTVTGNTVVDALHAEVDRQRQAGVAQQLDRRLVEAGGADLLERPLVLVTGHRRESFGGGFEQVCDALSTLADRFPQTLLVYPVHLNPAVRGVVHDRLSGRENIRLVEPLPYSEFVRLLSLCRVVLTDSGGVQEEAPSLGKPVLVMRDTTERPEGVDAGVVRLVGADRQRIVAGVAELLTDDAAHDRMARSVSPYGDGRAAERIVQACCRFLGA